MSTKKEIYAGVFGLGVAAVGVLLLTILMFVKAAEQSNLLLFLGGVLGTGLILVLGLMACEHYRKAQR